MPDPSELLDVAWLLSTISNPVTATDAQMRRAASTAYYAMFHMALRAAADRFMGPGLAATPGYSILYRGFDHGQMRRICEELRNATLKDRHKRVLQRVGVSRDMRIFAEVFIDLQDARHSADYDPTAQFLASNVATLIQRAKDGMDAFNRAPPDERADVLALLMVGARA